MSSFILKGNIIYSESPDRLALHENSYLICAENKSAGVYTEIPEPYRQLPVKDLGSQIVIPGLVDLHLHAPQYTYRALGMDRELLDWLNCYAFPEEACYESLTYADKAYRIFCSQMKKSATTRACIFATAHVPATILLMDMMEETGLKSYVGKVSMDRNAPDNLREKDSSTAEKAVLRWLADSENRYRNVKPMLTPRFIPSCTDELMMALGRIAKEKHLPVQSHLSENQGEIAWVKELCPEASCYGDAYRRFGLFGQEVPTIMAHGVWPSEEEFQLILDRGVYVVHCPQSNINVSSGIAPMRRYLEAGAKLGLGSDVAGGSTENLFRAMTDAIQVSKLYWRLVSQEDKPLTVDEAFYLGTAGGGSFFGKVGSFLPGYEFDAVVLDDSNLKTARTLNLHERLERILYLSDDRNIVMKYAAGEKVYQNSDFESRR